MEEVHVSKNAEDTARLGEEFAKKVTNGGILALYGQLGSGKTTFVQGLAKGLGIRKRIISPTFVIIRSYPTKNHELITHNFYHVDLYRIQRQEDVRGLGIEDIINDPHNIVAIEWAEKLGNLLPKERIDIEFEYIGEEKRKIKVKSF